MSGTGAVFVVVAMQILAGLGVLALIGLGSSCSALLRHSPIAPLAGMAWSGVIAATLATLGWRLDVLGLVVLTIVTCAGAAVRVSRGAARRRGESTARARHASWPERASAAAAVVVLAVVVAVALATFRVTPLSVYDAWAMWGMKARAIATLGGADLDVFASPAYARLHTEYPLLLPALHALPLQAADGFSSNTVVLSCLAIGLAGLLALWGLVRDRVRPALALPFLAAIATAPAFFGQLSTGYADIPLAVLVAAGVVAAARWLLEPEPAWLALATLFFAAAGLTKNEGLVFAIAACVPLFVAATGRRRAVAFSAFGVLLMYAPWAAFTTIHGLSAADYDLESSLNVPWVLERLDRAPPAAEGLLRLATDEQQWAFLLALAGLAVGLTLVCGPRRLGFFAAGFGLLSFAGLTWIYVLSLNGVPESLASNGSRIIVSPLVALAALSPLLIEKTARLLASADE